MSVYPNKKRSLNSKPDKKRKIIVQIPKGVEDNLTQYNSVMVFDL